MLTPAMTFRFHHEMSPEGNGIHSSSEVRMTEVLAPLMSPQMGNRLARAVERILAGLVSEAERK